VSKNHIDVALITLTHYQPILVIFGGDVVCYRSRTVICYPTWGNMNPEIVFSVVLGIHQDHPRRRIEIKFCVVLIFRGSSQVWISSKSVKRFWSCGWSKFALCHWFGQISRKRPNQWERANFDPQQLRNRLTNFDKIRTSELPYLLKTSHFHPTTWVVSANIQHDWKGTISEVHVSPGSAETLVRRGRKQIIIR